MYGVQCALTTLTCIYDCLEWEGELYTWEVKKELIFKLYMPWFLIRECPSSSYLHLLTSIFACCVMVFGKAPNMRFIALGMSVDMYLRILNRFRGQGEKTLKSQ